VTCVTIIGQEGPSAGMWLSLGALVQTRREKPSVASSARLKMGGACWLTHDAARTGRWRCPLCARAFYPSMGAPPVHGALRDVVRLLMVIGSREDLCDVRLHCHA